MLIAGVQSTISSTMSEFTRLLRSIERSRAGRGWAVAPGWGLWWRDRESLAAEFRDHCPPLSSEAIAFFTRTLEGEDRNRRLFAGYVLYHSATFPEAVYDSMMRAAIFERNPSVNRVFVQPCVRAFGARRVNETLLDYFENGSDMEIAGATQALYWANPRFEFEDDCVDKDAVHRVFESLRDVWTRKHRLFLREFVSNQSVMVRQRIIPQLHLREEYYPEDLRPLVGQAIEIARNHTDDYIRHRLEIKMGTGRELQFFSPLPAMDDSRPQAASLDTAQNRDPRITRGLRGRLKFLLDRLRRRS